MGMCDREYCSGTKRPAVVCEEMNGESGRCQELGFWQGRAGFEGERWSAGGILRRFARCLSETAIDFATVPYVADSNGVGGRIEFVDNAVITNSVAPGSFGAGQFKVRRNTRCFGQLGDGLENVPDCRGREFPQVFLYRRFEQDIISRHVSASQALLHFGKRHGRFFASLGNDCQIVKIFEQTVIFPDRQDDGFFSARGAGHIFGMDGLHGYPLKLDES